MFCIIINKKIINNLYINKIISYFMKKREVVLLVFTLSVLLINGVLAECGKGNCAIKELKSTPYNELADTYQQPGNTLTDIQWDVGDEVHPFPYKLDQAMWELGSSPQRARIPSNLLATTTPVKITNINKDLTIEQWRAILMTKYTMKPGNLGAKIESRLDEGKLRIKFGSDIKGPNFIPKEYSNYDISFDGTHAKLKSTEGTVYEWNRDRWMEASDFPNIGSLQSIQQTMSIIQGIPLFLDKINAFGNDEGETKVTKEETYTNFELKKGAELGMNDPSPQKFTFKNCEEANNQYCNENKKAEININNKLISSERRIFGIEGDIENTETRAYELATIHAAPKTDIQLAGDKEDADPDPEIPTYDEIDSRPGSFFAPPLNVLAISPISSNQYVQLLDHDLALGGEKIVVEIYKTFDNIYGNGNELWVENGDIKMRYNNERFYYPRKIEKGPHRINTIINELDSINQFHFQNYKNRKGELIHNNRRMFIGDNIFPHPRKPNLIIAQYRKDWWASR